MSNEWLTTGQMIDRLKVGEKAETVEFPPICINMKNDYVTYNGSCFVWSNGDQLMINDLTKYIKWSILPNYVSFEEAMRANNEGKIVKSWLFKETLPYNIHHPISEGSGKLKLPKFELLGDEIKYFDKLKWTIEDDTP